MDFIDVIIVFALVAILLGILFYIGKHKKKGNGCIGCPNSSSCGGSCGGESKK